MAQRLYIDNNDGYGERNFSLYLMNAGRFFRHDKNQPQLFDFVVTDIGDGGEWVVPRRGARVRFVDDRWERRHTEMQDGVLFTGYITEEPEPAFLGVNSTVDTGKVWAYKVKTSSEEFLANCKRLPVVTYVNKTRGYILADLLRRMFEDSPFHPFNLTGIHDGGIEQLYQVDTSQSWSELAASFAEADGYSYWVLDGFVFYGPNSYVTNSSDPLYNLVIDEEDPRYVPDNLDIRRVARDIVNDITVIGLPEPTDIVREHFVSDGYQGFHNLAFDPYGVEEYSIVEDDFTSDIDGGIWEEQDAIDDWIQAFDGALNVIGGTGTMGGAYLRGVKPIELSGILEFRDGEIYFPPGATGQAYIGGLYEDASVSVASLWNGWYLDLDANRITPYTPSGLATRTFPIVQTRHYVLRRTIQVDRPVGSPQSYTQSSTGSSYSIVPGTGPNIYMTWTVDEINNDDVTNVYTTSATYTLNSFISSPPSYVLFAPVATIDAHFVMNYLSVRKPQQATLQVNGRQYKLGSYLDGGRGSLLSENGRGKLSWYSVANGGSDSIPSYLNTVLGHSPLAYWRMTGPSGGYIGDVSGWARHSLASNVTGGQVGAIDGDNDTSCLFNGTNSYSVDAGCTTAATCSFEVWFRTTSSASGIYMWSNRTAAGTGDFIGMDGGYVIIGSNDIGQITSVRGSLHDDKWHHVVWTQDNAAVTKGRLYIDGVADTAFLTAKSVKISPSYIGKDQFADTVAPGSGYWPGYLDEIAIYDNVVLSAEDVKQHYARGVASLNAVVTVPPIGASIALSYYRKQVSRARLRSSESILTEKERYGDDGVRQKIIRSDDINPQPRTSEECLALAQALLTDSAFLRYEGDYKFEAVQDTPTELRFFPKPGDKIKCLLDLPSGDELDAELVIESVESVLIGKEAYAITLGFGAVNRWDAVLKDLILKRKTSQNDPVIRTDQADELEVLNQEFPYPGDLLDAQVTNITATQFSISLSGGGVPADVVNYEVREDDTGWGQTNADSGYVTRFNATTHTFDRPKRDLRYFIRPYNAAGQYSKRSAFIRVACPSANNYTVTGVTGDISGTRVSVRIPIPRDPDYAGIRLQHINSGGSVLYKGNGDYHEILGGGVSVILEAGFMTIEVPNRGYLDNGGLPGFLAHVNTYNLLNLYGTAQTELISTAAEGAWTTQTFASGDFTGNGAMTWTVGSGDVTDLSHTIVESTATVGFNLVTTTVGGTPNNELRIAIPGLNTAARAMSSAIVISDNGTRVTGTASVAVGGSYISIQRLDQANFSASANNTAVLGQLIFEIQ